MKKYIQISIVSMLAVIVIGGHYVYSAVVSEFPHFNMKHVYGDEKELESLILSGKLINEFGSEEGVRITSEGSSYVNELPFLKKMDTSQFEAMNDLKNRYRRFTRGKYNYESHYYENEEVLAYATIEYDRTTAKRENRTFEISFLAKETGKETDFSIPVPNTESYAQIFMKSLQWLNDELIVTVYQVRQDGEGEFIVYSFDPTEERLIEAERVISLPFQPNYEKELIILRDDRVNRGNKYVVFREMSGELEEGHERENGDLEVSSRHATSQTIYVYNLETKQLTEHPLPEQIATYENYILDHDTLYLMAEEAGHLNIVPFHLEQKEIGSMVVIDVQKTDSSWFGPLMISEQKLYYIIQHVHQLRPKVGIADVRTGDILYQGVIEVRDVDKYHEGLTLDIIQIYLEK